MRYILTLLAFLALPAPAMACTDVALVLLADVSTSMNTAEKEIQRAGYIDAFRSEEVISAITGGSCGEIKVAYVEFATSPYVIVDWQTINNKSSANRFSDMIRDAAEIPIPSQSSLTGMAVGMAFAGEMLSGVEADKFVIDVSADGTDNVTHGVEIVRDNLITATAENGWREITINGLVVGNDTPYGLTVEELEDYFRSKVIGGPGCFSIIARRIEDLSHIVRQKLVI